ncbi:TetR/AcrR family transcriptional regulator [Mycolicibacterium brumae]|uniref:TetR family transcriptional regulator n=1 Tax=Mycolicibacterium brumae TaxID=85968 RepID=A0A2G5PG10_9MYCO|nr:TetR/AcrR family transcriptional regulator [Mycolicibacterium brumae]MCV7194346.1 TetR family transcriptional regulator [Mycolicibacterium brumae]PIB77255.1 TetR family transcriptional regulator [Mycolicibacterium brumae]RWA15504.1 hypothetical protein MBRU_10665 [Mycolicibacterium brumae DSM 44177]UWW10617.1 TetR/AcrR family transcriptional regulator [Mycolicibacterium brumae]
MSTTIGLRERRRLEVLRDLNDAAVTLTEKAGFGDATIDLIAERAGVSRRTFFNYYASKEDAVLGVVPPTVSEQVLAVYDSDDGDRFSRTVRLIVSIIHSTLVDGVAVAQRRALIAQYPQLRERMSQHMAAAEALAETVLGERAAALGAPAEPPGVLAMLASAVLRHAYSRDPHALESADSPAIEASIAAFRDAIRELA